MCNFTLFAIFIAHMGHHIANLAFKQNLNSIKQSNTQHKSMISVITNPKYILRFFFFKFQHIHSVTKFSKMQVFRRLISNYGPNASGVKNQTT